MVTTHTTEHNRLMEMHGDRPGFYVARVTQGGPYAKLGNFVKFGQTTTGLNKRVKCHTKDFDTFNLVIFVPSTHIERAFKVNPLVCQNRVTGGFQTRDSNHSEILQLSATFPLSAIQQLVNAILQQPGMGVVEVIDDEQPVVEEQCPEFMWYNARTAGDLTSEGFHLKDAYPAFSTWYQAINCNAYPGSLRKFGSALRNCGVKTPAFRIQGGRDMTSGIQGRRLLD